jgi:DNA replication and repair protein RecF
LAITHLSVRTFRNLASIDLELGAGFNVFSGDNGQGKTNLLEAVYVLATSKSFRTAKPGDLVQHDRELASIRGTVDEDGAVREQSVGVKPGVRVARIDGRRPKSLAEYAVATPVVVFHPGVVSLSMGSGAERRKLLDRIALYLAPGSLAELESYTRAVRERQRALEARGIAARDVEHFEELVVRHGTAVLDARRRAAARLVEAARETFRRIGAPGLELEARYTETAPGGPDAYRAALASARPVDMRRGSASIGPHRDDLTLSLGGHTMRGVASQGQHRAVVLALKLAEIAVIASARGVRPILLLDDVSSELDRARTAALFAHLRQHDGQVLLTTTRPELIDTGSLTNAALRRDFWVEAGSIHASGAAGFLRP